MSLLYLTFVLIFVMDINGELDSSPPHCTVLTKDTDYISSYKFDYPLAYIAPGQQEAYQKLYCINPPTIAKASARVCDWAAPPLVQYTLGDEYLHVVRQDPSGRFLGNAVITTLQLCGHNIPPHTANDIERPDETKVEI